MNLQNTAGIIGLSLKIGTAATLINLPVAMLSAYFLARFTFRGKGLLDGIVNLPLVLPPVTTGYLLLLILGKRGVIGSAVHSIFGISIAFTTAAAVIASMVVSFPLITRSIRVSLEMLDGNLEKAALTLGASRTAVFLRVTLPQILPGVIGGIVLGFARSLGEFGATITFAGNIAGHTRTIPLAVYTLLQIPGKEKDAAGLVALSAAISFAALFMSSVVNRSVDKKKKVSHGTSI